MFTGLIEEIGKVKTINQYGNGYRINILASTVLQETKLGDSIAVNGVCLTVVELFDQSFTVEAVQETVTRTALAGLTNQTSVNLERALPANGRLGGHFVQGHVDGVATVVSFRKKDPGYWLTLKIPADILQFMVEKGSVAVNGISLTIASLEKDELSVAIIPHTGQATTLEIVKPGEQVNIEADILAKYINKMINGKEYRGITPESLERFGY